MMLFGELFGEFMLLYQISYSQYTPSFQILYHQRAGEIIETIKKMSASAINVN